MATKVLQQLDLSQRSLGENLLAEDIGDLLDCYAFAGLIVCCRTASHPSVTTHLSRTALWRGPNEHDRLLRFDDMDGLRMHSVDSPHNSVCSLAELFRHIIALIDNEILIEYLEDLSALQVCHILPRCGSSLPICTFLPRAQ